MNTPLNAVMQKEMSRKEFLRMSGLTVISVLGFGTIIKLLTNHSFNLNEQVVSGYGSSAYGGSSEGQRHSASTAKLR